MSSPSEQIAKQDFDYKESLFQDVLTTNSKIEQLMDEPV